MVKICYKESIVKISWRIANDKKKTFLKQHTMIKWKMSCCRYSERSWILSLNWRMITKVCRTSKSMVEVEKVGMWLWNHNHFKVRKRMLQVLSLIFRGISRTFFQGCPMLCSEMNTPVLIKIMVFLVELMPWCSHQEIVSYRLCKEAIMLWMMGIRTRCRYKWTLRTCKSKWKTVNSCPLLCFRNKSV